MINESSSSGPETKKRVIVYSCSGCSDAGELADRIARKLSREGAAEMSCLAGIGGRVKSLVSKAAGAERILAIDGCPLNCARHTLRLAGFEEIEHLELHKLGMRKNSCPVTEERIATGVEAAKQMISQEPLDESCYGHDKKWSVNGNSNGAEYQTAYQINLVSK